MQSVRSGDGDIRDIRQQRAQPAPGHASGGREKMDIRSGKRELSFGELVEIKQRTKQRYEKLPEVRLGRRIYESTLFYSVATNFKRWCTCCRWPSCVSRSRSGRTGCRCCKRRETWMRTAGYAKKAPRSEDELVNFKYWLRYDLPASTDAHCHRCCFD
jgi:hypothetical protein